MNKYFTYSPDRGFETHSTLEEAHQAADEMIQEYCDDGWDPEVTRVVMGCITESAVQTDILRPDGQIDEDGYDEAGIYWNGEHDRICNYKMKPLGYKENGGN